MFNSICISGAVMDQVKGRSRCVFIGMVSLCVTVTLLYALFTENTGPSSIFTGRTQTRAQLSEPLKDEAQGGDESKEEKLCKEEVTELLKPIRVQELCNDHVWNDEMSRSMLGSKMETVVQKFYAMNKYGVKLSGPVSVSGRRKLTGPELLCQLKRRIEVTTLTSDLKPFSALLWATQLPTKQLTSELGPYKSCAVVSSAGALLGSELGEEIDFHDAVIRFNGAPTRGFERDVGSKITIRLINSKVMAAHTHNFYSSLYKSGVLVAWDPAPFSSNLSQWYKQTEYPIFLHYLNYKNHHPKQPFYILHPRFGWQLWQLIQDNMDEPIQKNPPSSGFLGIVLMMSLCEVVHVYEFLPSHRVTDRCHYYQNFKSDACTFGAYHPLMYEKNLVKRMNLGSAREIYMDGRVTLPGFRMINCNTDGAPKL